MYLARVDDRMSLEILEGIETICGGILRHYSTLPSSLLCTGSSAKPNLTLISTLFFKEYLRLSDQKSLLSVHSLTFSQLHLSILKSDKTLEQKRGSYINGKFLDDELYLDLPMVPQIDLVRNCSLLPCSQSVLPWEFIEGKG